MDSLVSDINKLVILKIAQIYQVPATKSHLSIHSISIQQQKGSTDCGLFAIAFATETCTGPVTLNLFKVKCDLCVTPDGIISCNCCGNPL